MFRFVQSVVVLVVFACSVGFILAQPNCSQPPPRNNIQQCCAKQNVLAVLADDCIKKMNPQGPMMKQCFAACIFNGTGVLDNGSGEIIMEKAKGFIAEKFKDIPEMLTVMNTAITKCESLAKEKIANMKGPSPPRPPGSENCQILADMITHCTLMESFINCPASLWQNNEPCNTAKEYKKACPMGPPPPAA